MLSLTASTCKHCQKNAYKLKNTSVKLYNHSLIRFQGQSSRSLFTINRNRINNRHVKQWNATPCAKTISTKSPTQSSEKDDYNYDSVLSVALDQSNVVIAQTLTDNTIRLLKQGNPELAWECYKDLTSQHSQKYITRDQYNILVRRFFNQKNSALGLEAVLTLVEDMKMLGYKVGRKERLLVMKLLGQNGMIKEMESIYEDLKNDGLLIVSDEIQTRKAFNVVLYAYGEQKKTLGFELVAENIMRVYDEMLEYRVQPAAQATVMLLESIRTAGYSDAMIDKVHHWIRPKITEDVEDLMDPAIYGNVVYYFANAGHPNYALEVNDFMVKNNIPREIHVITALMHKVGRAGDIDRSMQLFDEMINKEGLEPNIVTFNALIDVHAHKRPEPDVEGANRVYDMLRDAGLNPDIYTFGTLIDMFAKKGDLPMLQRVYRYMSRRRNIRPNDYVSSSIVECFVKLGDMDSALQTLIIGRSAGMKTTVVLDLVFQGFINNGRLADAFSLLKSVKRDIGLSTRTFLPLLNYYANKGDTKSAHKVAGLLLEADLPTTSNVYTALLKSHAKARDPTGAERIFQVYKTKWRLDINIYNALLYAYVKDNDMEKVFETYSLISKAYVKPNEQTYSILMHFYSRRRDVQAVESIMDRMTANGITPGIVSKTTLMQTYFEANRSLDARNIMDQILQSGQDPTPHTWGVLVNGCAKSNELEFAESILQEAIERSKNSPRHRNNLLQNVSNKYIHNMGPYEVDIPETVGDLLDKANEALLTGKSVLSSYLFNPLIDAYSKNGNFARAKELFNTMVDLNVPVTVPVYVTLMNMFQNEKHYEAVEVMWNALQKSTKYQEFINGIDPDIHRIPIPEKYYDYAHLLSVTDERTIQVDEPSKETIPEQSSYFALSVYIDSLIDQGRNEEVEALWNRLESENYQFDEQNWNRYIVSLLMGNNLEKACQLVSEHFLASETVEESEEDTSSQSVKKHERKRDNLDVDTSNQIHDRTCFLFANLFQIPDRKSVV